ncbi:hypothetical protein GF362_01380 [Candidatus Dojkabacteria bacterium]|nr:hypothetical protein [Candidatus Dojkabacteria bacterium]
MNLTNIFKQLGLKEEHEKVYLANLAWGETIITNLARKTKIPRTTVYLLIEDLLNFGLVTQTLKNGKTYYVPASPEILETLLEQKQKQLQNSIFELKSKMSDIKAMNNSNSKKPKVEFLEGSEGIKQAYERTFEAEEIWIQCLTEDYQQVIPDNFFEDYFNRFFKKSDIKSKEILKLDDEDYVSKYQSDKNLQLRVPIQSKTETDFWVYDNKVTFISFNKDRPYALVIEDEDIARCVRNMYDLAWKRASEIDPRVRKGKEVRTDF